MPIPIKTVDITVAFCLNAWICTLHKKGNNMDTNSSPRLFTHMKLDLDAAWSAWATKVFVPRMAQAQVLFMPANWDGAGMTDLDMAVDICAGGRGIKGQQEGTLVSSAFAMIIQMHASPEDQLALAPFVKFVDAQDMHGSAYEYYLADIAPEVIEIFSRTGLNACFRAAQTMYRNNDPELFRFMSFYFNGLLKTSRSQVRAEEEAVQFAEYIGDDRRVAIMRYARFTGTNHALFRHGVQAIVYVDGFNIGVTNRKGKIRCDHPLIRAVVEPTGEKWFIHPAGYVFGNGTRKSPATKPSKVDPFALARAALAALDAEAAATIADSHAA